MCQAGQGRQCMLLHAASITSHDSCAAHYSTLQCSASDPQHGPDVPCMPGAAEAWFLCGRFWSQAGLARLDL